MTLHGADVYIKSPQTPDLPHQVGPFSLVFISNRGTRVWPPPAPEMSLLDLPQCRFFSDAEVTDDQVEALVNELVGLGWTWVKCQKLYRIDGVDGFSQPY